MKKPKKIKTYHTDCDYDICIYDCSDNFKIAIVDSCGIDRTEIAETCDTLAKAKERAQYYVKQYADD